MEPGWLYGWWSKGRNSVQGRAVNASFLYQLFTGELGLQLSWWCACLGLGKLGPDIRVQRYKPAFPALGGGRKMRCSWSSSASLRPVWTVGDTVSKPKPNQISCRRGLDDFG